MNEQQIKSEEYEHEKVALKIVAKSLCIKIISYRYPSSWA